MPPSGTAIKIDYRQADVFRFEGDAIVIPGNSEGLMVDGLAAKAKSLIGPTFEQEVQAHVPIAVGASFVCSAGSLKVKHIIFAPLVELPGQHVVVENLRRATRAALLAATRHAMEKIAIPGMGFGPFGVPHPEAARAIIEEVNAYRSTHPTHVSVVEADTMMYHALIEHTGTR